MLEVLISGRLIRDPQTRQGKSGQNFTTALVRVPAGHGEDHVVASVIAFQGEGEKLARLRAGDSVSVAGSAKLTVWQKEGEARPGLDVTASGILSPYETRKRQGAPERKAANGSAPTGRTKGNHGPGSDTGRADAWGVYARPEDAAPFNDPLNF